MGSVVRTGRGLLNQAAELMADAGLNGRAFVVTDRNVYAHFGQPLSENLARGGFEPLVNMLNPGEQTKSLRTLEVLYDWLADARAERTDVIVALGGGVVGDLAGFLAASYLRGMPLVQIPTTLLAQVDASIGGKTGVNHPRAKNLIGAIHQPALVVSDIDTLRSLPPRELRSGMAEVIKTGVIGAPDLFEDLEAHIRAALAREPGVLARVVGRCAEYKAGIVAGDEREEAGRVVLNYGHTIGHGIEAAAGYRRVTHGEAIAVGMTLEARLAVRLGVCDETLLARQTRLLAAAGLPVRLADICRGRPPARSAIAAAMAHDKKARAGRLRLVLPARLGATVLREDLPAGLLEEVLDDG